MKKRNLKTLKITKTIVSNFDKQKLKGGTDVSVLVFTFCCTVQKH
jgi:hypothetical protein